ncbi:MAG: hypothetical protein G01um101433_790 [Parcubacteria group bacterium Gr01-1014_33]|nr:MAG: hypothetical protein G01um101433_790 [Parcubacteria group bacterium Gr01-1014_33]
MHQYQVPQFITVEDRVIGPLTVKQFFFLAGGTGLALMCYKLFVSFISVPIAALILSLAGALAFLKINGQPFPTVLKNVVLYTIRPRLYIWKKGGRQDNAPPLSKTAKKETEPGLRAIPKISQSKLSDLAWSLDIKERGHEL